ncbi:MAG: GNAT family N-acetyltransferase [Usitatibacter sp.]
MILEPQVAAHAEEMFAVLGDPAIYEFENDPPPSLEWLRGSLAKLESRCSPDGTEKWLNWVIRTDEGLAGYVQATVHADASADIAYVLASPFWGRGLAAESVNAMIAQLRDVHGVRKLGAIFKGANLRSRRLLERLGFRDAIREEVAARGMEPDEMMMVRDA